MPRRNHPRRKSRNGYLPAEMKPKGKARPRDWHHGPLRDEHFAEADRLLREAEGEAA